MARRPTSRSPSNAGRHVDPSGADTLAHYAKVLAAVSYRSTVADPTSGGANADRTITWQVNDGALDSQTRETRLHIDRPPVLGLDPANPGAGFLTTYTENAAAIAVAGSNVAIADPDSPTMDSAGITLTNAKPFDSLSVDGPLPGGIGFSLDTSVAGTITLRLFNAASLADYQAAIGLVRFKNASDAPETSDRDITVTVSGGNAQSNVTHATVHVLGVNDAPVNACAGHAGGRGQSGERDRRARDRGPGRGRRRDEHHAVGRPRHADRRGARRRRGVGQRHRSVTISGTLAAINATLGAAGNVVYAGDHDYFGTDTLRMVTSDDGNSGSGGAADRYRHGDHQSATRISPARRATMTSRRSRATRASTRSAAAIPSLRFPPGRCDRHLVGQPGDHRRPVESHGADRLREICLHRRDGGQCRWRSAGRRPVLLFAVPRRVERTGRRRCSTITRSAGTRGAIRTRSSRRGPISRPIRT